MSYVSPANPKDRPAANSKIFSIFLIMIHGFAMIFTHFWLFIAYFG